MNKKTILIISRTAWRNDNSFGNSFSNLFHNLTDFNIVNIYCSGETPSNQVVSEYFQISEHRLITNLFNKSHPSGEDININFSEKKSLDFSNNKFFKKNRWILLFWIREFIWKVSRWKSNELKLYLRRTKPDIVFLPIYHHQYSNRIGLFASEFCKVKIIGYISDDHITLNQFSINPLFWIDRLITRTRILKIFQRCALIYVITNKQRLDYQKLTTKQIKILFKGGYFSKSKIGKNTKRERVKLLYTGNLGDGRYLNLLKIAQVLEELNKNGIKGELEIYTATNLPRRVEAKLKDFNYTNIYDPISAQEVREKQKEADILIHTESFKRKHRLIVKHSLSTKIVDYLQSGNAIFAFGPVSVASIQYLNEEDAAIVVSQTQDLKTKLLDLISSENLRNNYAKKAHQCGLKNHDLNKISQELRKDIYTHISK